MRNKNKDFELDLEDYVDEDYEENFYSMSADNTLSMDEEEYNNFFKVDDDYSTDYETYTDTEDNYEDFVKVQEVDDQKEEEEYSPEEAYTYDDENPLYKFLAIFLVVFKWLGIAIAVVLVAFFITQGQLKTLLLYIIGLVAAFFFGYFFMYVLNKFNEE